MSSEQEKTFLEKRQSRRDFIANLGMYGGAVLTLGSVVAVPASFAKREKQIAYREGMSTKLYNTAEVQNPEETVVSVCEDETVVHILKSSGNNRAKEIASACDTINEHQRDELDKEKISQQAYSEAFDLNDNTLTSEEIGSLGVIVGLGAMVSGLIGGLDRFWELDQ